MKYKRKTNLKTKTIHNKIKQNKFYNFKLLNKKIFCIGLLPNNKNYLVHMFSIKNKVKKSVNRNVLKRLFKEYIRVFQCNLINLYIAVYTKKYIFKIIGYILLNKLLRKLINF